MAKFYSKERSKYGNLTGQVIIWPVEYTGGNPDEGLNPTNMPAGYLKCDGGRYFAEDYPQLAAILGTGSNTTFKRTTLDGSDYDSVPDTQFMVPDLGSKYPEPTSGANTGVYNNVRTLNKEDVEKSRSGIGIEATVTQGNNGTIPLTYSGTIVVPSQEIPIPGKPSYQYGTASHYTESGSVEDNAIHPHAHFHQGVKPRTMTTDPSETNDKPKKWGYTGRYTASTIDIEDWLDNTRYDQSNPENNSYGSTGNPDGGGQNTCKAINQWNPNAGTTWSNFPVFHNHPINDTIYWGGCIDGAGQQEYTYACILNKATKFDWGYTWASPDGVNTTYYMQTFKTPPLFLFCCPICGKDDTPYDGGQNRKEVAPTYIAGATGVPVDFAGVSLADVLPLNSEEGTTTRRAIVSVNAAMEETRDLTQESGDPTTHTHRIRLEPDGSVNGGDHNYKVKTRAMELDPENLRTTITMGADASHSIDSATQPFIIMEYLIKT